MIHAIWTLDANAAVQSFVAISVLIGIVLLLRKPVASLFGAGAAYFLWVLPLARFALPPLPANFSLFSLAPQQMSAFSADPPAAMPETPAPVHIEPVTAGVAEALPAHGVDLPVTWTSAAMVEVASSNAGVMIASALGLIWLAGAVYFLLRSVISHQSFLRVVKAEAEPVSQRLERTADEVARALGMKSRPRITSSLISSGPLVTGLARPVILLPAWFETDYDLSEQRAALAHEMMHVRRGDIWALQLSEIVSAVFWFNPLIWMARPAFRLDQEAACDADVLRAGVISPHAYGSTLLKAVRISLPERLPSGASLALTHGIKERMFRMTRPAPTQRRRLIGTSLTALIGSAALMASASVSATAGEIKTITIDDGTLVIDGKTVKDRQFVLLGDPFEGTEPDPAVEAEIERMSREIEREANELAGVEMEAMQFDFDLHADDVPMPAIPPLPPIVLDFDTLPHKRADESKAAYEERVHAWAERIEAKAEAAAARAEAHAEARQASRDARAEAHAERKVREAERMATRIEARTKRIDARSAELEAFVESRFGDDFEARIEAASTAIDTLVDACVDADLAGGEVRIVEHTGPDGKTHRAACVHGDEAALQSTATTKAIIGNDALCDTEKHAFKQIQKGQHSLRIER